MTVKEVTSLTEFQEIIARDKVSIFEFWATWCPRSEDYGPIFEGYSNLAKSIEFYKVDIKAAIDIAKEAGILSTPTFIAFKGGKMVGYVASDFSRNLRKLVSLQIDAVRAQ